MNEALIYIHSHVIFKNTEKKNHECNNKNAIVPRILYIVMSITMYRFVYLCEMLLFISIRFHIPLPPPQNGTGSGERKKWIVHEREKSEREKEKRKQHVKQGIEIKYTRFRST